MADVELLPCPFCCGTEIYTVPMEHPSVGEYWMVGCNNSDCPMDTDRVKIEGGTLEKAAAIWNTRATDANVAPLQAENERLQREVEALRADGVHSCGDHCQRGMCVLRRRAERLAEALRPFAEAHAAATRYGVVASAGDLGAIAAHHVSFVHFAKASAALQDQEDGNG